MRRFNDITPGQLGYSAFEPGNEAATLAGLIDYGKELPPTTNELVNAQLRALSVEEARSIFGFFEKPRTGAEAKDLLKRWSDLAWNTMQAVEKAYGEASSISIKGLFRGEDLSGFLVSWRKQLDEQRRRWDLRHPPKEALRKLLDESASVAISEELKIETLRQASSYVGHAKYSIEFARQTQDTIKALRARDADLNAALELSDEALGGAISSALSAVGTILAWAAKTTVKGLAKGLPWWAWVAGLGFVAWKVAPIVVPLLAARRASK